MKAYIAPECDVIKLSFTESFLTESNGNLGLHDKVGAGGQYSEKKGGWDSSAWTAGDEEEE